MRGRYLQFLCAVDWFHDQFCVIPIHTLTCGIFHTWKLPAYLTYKGVSNRLLNDTIF